MAKIKEWRKKISKISDLEIEGMLKALKVLRSWDFFKKQYDWTALWNIQEIIETEINQRREHYRRAGKLKNIKPKKEVTKEEEEEE